MDTYKTFLPLAFSSKGMRSMRAESPWFLSVGRRTKTMQANPSDASQSWMSIFRKKIFDNSLQTRTDFTTLPPLPMSHRTKSMTREVGLNYPKQIGDSRRGRSFTHSTQGTSTTKRWVCKPSMKKTIIVYHNAVSTVKTRIGGCGDAAKGRTQQDIYSTKQPREQLVVGVVAEPLSVGGTTMVNTIDPLGDPPERFYDVIYR